MEVIRSRVDTRGRSYRARYEAMAERVAVLTERLARARSERSERSLERLRGQGKLTVDERLALLLDPGEPWLEIAPLAAWGMYGGGIHQAGARLGIGTIQGRRVLVHANDPTIKGGTLFPMGVKKLLRAQAIAMANRLPLVMLVDSGGIFLPLQGEMFPDLDGTGRVFRNQAVMSRAGIPQLTAVLGHCTAGGAYVPAMSDQVVHVEGTGAIFLAGPPLVEAATGERVSVEELGGARLHTEISGVSDHLARDEAHAMELLRDLVGLLPRVEAPREREPREPLYDPRELWGILPDDPTEPLDAKDVLARLLDGSEFLEFRAGYGRSLVCGWGYVHGHRVGILANQGALFSDSALKAVHFIRMADRDGVPLLFLQNVSGFMVGREYEAGGIVKHGAEMVHAVATATVPKLTVIMGASYGAGNYAMCGRAYDPRFLWTWPGSRVAVMGPREAGEVMVSVKRAQRRRRGLPDMTDAEEARVRGPVEERLGREEDPYHGTARLWDDGILDPARTRDVLGLALEVVSRVPRDPGPSGPGLLRM